jgi:MOSC domain-containing protein YiiM
LERNRGQIFQINLSPGGVPKLAVLEAELTPNGLVGDDVRHPHVHGGPERAVCLYSLERLLELQKEGHPIFPGAMGENLTLSGLDWEQLQPGRRLRLGEVRIEITNYTVPCNALQPFFIDGKYSRVSQNHYPGWARVYARVLQPGRLKVGNSVELEADESSGLES